MLVVIGLLLPVAVAAAFSTIPILASLLILLSPNQRRSSPAFLLGWVLGLAGLTVAAAFGLAALPAESPVAHRPLAAIIEMIVGAAVLGYGVWMFFHPPAAAKLASPWMKAMGSLGPWPSFGLGFALNLWPKSLLIAVAAGLIINRQPLPPSSLIVALAVYLVISSSTVAVPVLLTHPRGARDDATAAAPDAHSHR